MPRSPAACLLVLKVEVSGLGAKVQMPRGLIVLLILTIWRWLRLQVIDDLAVNDPDVLVPVRLQPSVGS